MHKEILDKIKTFKPKNILVIGDLILDKYTIGGCSRISQEAPVPIVEVKEKKYNPGGASNTALNIIKMGSKAAIYGALGYGKEGLILKEKMQKAGADTSGILFLKEIKTIVKERIVSHNQQIVRLDHNDNIPNLKIIEDHILKGLDKKYDVIIISDYGKGTISDNAVKKIIEFSNKNNIKIIIDPKDPRCEPYKNAYIITPNFKEACGMLGVKQNYSFQYAKNIAKTLQEKLNCIILLTLSENGILICGENGLFHIPTFKREVTDVSGAGDTVVAALSIALANGLSLKEATFFANHAAGVKVEKTGVQPVFMSEIIEDIKKHNSL